MLDDGEALIACVSGFGNLLGESTVRPSAAKAGLMGWFNGTAEAVP